MIETVKQVIVGQFEAALAMVSHCAAACPAEHWEGCIANNTFRQVAYHALFFADYYLSPHEDAFQLRELHRHGGDEREAVVSPGLSKDETIQYAATCRQKANDIVMSETPETLMGPSGFSFRRISRLEMHVYNIRHLQHHVGQLSAYLRRVDPSLGDRDLPWIGTGWR
jgi:DinB superfamily